MPSFRVGSLLDIALPCLMFHRLHCPLLQRLQWHDLQQEQPDVLSNGDPIHSYCHNNQLSSRQRSKRRHFLPEDDSRPTMQHEHRFRGVWRVWNFRLPFHLDQYCHLLFGGRPMRCDERNDVCGRQFTEILALLVCQPQLHQQRHIPWTHRYPIRGQFCLVKRRSPDQRPAHVYMGPWTTRWSRFWGLRGGQARNLARCIWSQWHSMREGQPLHLWIQRVTLSAGITNTVLKK